MNLTIHGYKETLQRDGEIVEIDFADVVKVRGSMASDARGPSAVHLRGDPETVLVVKEPMPAIVEAWTQHPSFPVAK